MTQKTAIIGQSQAMQLVWQLIDRISGSNRNVLILGESGTGKELVAQTIHHLSHRRDRPWMAVNCSALPEGLLESELFGHVKGAFTSAYADKTGLFVEAGDGTIFLDEVGDMSLLLQAKLLRVLQERRIRPVGGNKEVSIQARVIASTNRDLRCLIKQGTFREDLYYRLSVIPIKLPPLRERVEDIPLLACHFLEQIAQEAEEAPKQISPEAMTCLTAHPWPGNIRELENIIERAHLLTRGPTIERANLLSYLEGEDGATRGRSPATGYFASIEAGSLPPLRELNRAYVSRVLDENGGNVLRTSRVLGVCRKTVTDILKRI